MRCFVACFLSAESAHRLGTRLEAAWTPPARARLVPRANYHVTLRFFGEVCSAEVSGLLAAVAELGGHDLSCTTGPVTGLPRPARARVIAVGVEPSSPLTDWADALSGIDPEPEGRAFLPHVTLARIRGTMRVPQIGGLAGVELALHAPSLYETVPVDGGVRYRRVEPERFGSG